MMRSRAQAALNSRGPTLQRLPQRARHRSLLVARTSNVSLLQRTPLPSAAAAARGILRSARQYQYHVPHRSNTTGTDRWGTAFGPARRVPAWLFRPGAGPGGGQIPVLQYLRFLLYGMIISPLAYWVVSYTMAYLERVKRMRRVLSSPEATFSERRCVGRDSEMNALQRELSLMPRHISVVCGPNEAGKTRLLSSVLRDRPATRLVDLLGRPIASANDLVRALVRGFNAEWLHIRLAAVSMLPVAGSEVLVLKERYSVDDLHDVLEVATLALEQYWGNANPYVLSDDKPGKQVWPVIVLDGFGDWDADWLQTKEGRECMSALLRWCLYITKERRLAHVVCTADEQFSLMTADELTVTRSHMKFFCIGEINRAAAKQYLRAVLPERCRSDDDVALLINNLGCWIHDLTSAANELRANARATPRSVVARRLAMIVERLASALDVTATSAVEEQNEDGASAEDEPGSLQGLRETYSSRVASDHGAEFAPPRGPKWTPRQLWQTVEMIADRGAVPFAELRAEVFDGNGDAIVDLIRFGLLGFALNDSTGDAIAADATDSTFWQVTAATPLMTKAFKKVREQGTVLGSRMHRLSQAADRSERRTKLEQARLRVNRDMAATARLKDGIARTSEVSRLADVDMHSEVRAHLRGALKHVLAREEEQLATIAELHQQIRRLRDDRSADAVRPPPPSHKEVRDALLHIVSQLTREAEESGDGGTSAPATAAEGQARAAFRRLDIGSRDGSLSVDELTDALINLPGLKIPPRAARVASERVIAAADANRDGKLSEDEFVSAYAKAIKEVAR